MHVQIFNNSTGCTYDIDFKIDDGAIIIEKLFIDGKLPDMPDEEREELIEQLQDIIQTDLTT